MLGKVMGGKWTILQCLLKGNENNSVSQQPSRFKFLCKSKQLVLNREKVLAIFPPVRLTSCKEAISILKHWYRCSSICSFILALVKARGKETTRKTKM
jgi:hypothetical protein